MTRPEPLTAMERQRILDLHDGGESSAWIATLTGRAVSTVQRALALAGRDTARPRRGTTVVRRAPADPADPYAWLRSVARYSELAADVVPVDELRALLVERDQAVAELGRLRQLADRDAR